MDKTFGKSEKLVSKTTIDALFDKNSKSNQSFLVYPIKTIFNVNSEIQDSLPKVLISVSSRKFKKAVDRNLIKRRIREAYRLNKVAVSQSTQIVFIYVANQIEDFGKIQKSMVKTLQKITS